VGGSTPPQLREDLRRAGAPCSDLWELVTTNIAYPAAIPVLLDWLEHLDERLPADTRDKTHQVLVRALTVVEDPSGLGLRWVIGNALEVVADDSVFDDLEALVRDEAFGRARQMVVLGLGRSQDRRAVPVLIDLLNDPDVAAHAAIALGKLRAAEACSALEEHLADPQPLVRREAKKALTKLGRQLP
jgi:HEAT repeat protein